MSFQACGVNFCSVYDPGSMAVALRFEVIAERKYCRSVFQNNCSPGRPTKVTFMFAVSITVDVEKFLALPDRLSPLNVPLKTMAFTPASVTLHVIVIFAEKKNSNPVRFQQETSSLRNTKRCEDTSAADLKLDRQLSQQEQVPLSCMKIANVIFAGLSKTHTVELSLFFPWAAAELTTCREYVGLCSSGLRSALGSR